MLGLLLLAIFLSVAQILLRGLFDSGIFWADSALRVMVLWIGLLGAMYASHQGKHIRIDIFSRYLSRRLRNVFYRLTEFVTAIMCGIATFYSARFVMFEYQDGLIAFANVPTWLCESIIPVAFFVMSVRYLLATLIGAIPTVNES